MAKAKASNDKATAEAERCKKLSTKAIKEHSTMKEQYTNMSNKLQWFENKLKLESDHLGKSSLKDQN